MTFLFIYNYVNLNERLKKELNTLKENYHYRSLKQVNGLIDFSSNDYLGISHLVANGEIPLESTKASGSGGSRLLAGNYAQIEELEVFLADIHRGEGALVFNTGYTANLGFFSAVPSKGSTIIYDQKIHACVKDGMRLSLASKTSFKHNDVQHLAKKLRGIEGEKYVVVESVYSMDGDQAPLEKLTKLCEQYEAYLVVDEAHSTAIYGDRGAGLVSQLGLDDLVFAKIHTFGKGVGSHGACVVGSEVLIDYLINKSRPFIYTTAMPPGHAQDLLSIYRYISQNYNQLQGTIQGKIQLFRKTIKQLDVNSVSPIQVVIISGNEEVRAVAQKIQAEGYDVRPVMSPTVQKGEERLRICLHNYNSDQEIVELAHLINSLK